MAKTLTCPDCHGTKKLTANTPKGKFTYKCSSCNGNGTVSPMKEGLNKPGGKQFGTSGERLQKKPCKHCDGTGNISKSAYFACPNCKGTGTITIDPGLAKQRQQDFQYEDGNATGAIGGFNAPMGVSKKGVKHNISIKEDDSSEVIVDMKKGDGLAKYLKLHNSGWITKWSGEGKICLVPPKKLKEGTLSTNEIWKE
jgi:hypothetical protein